MTGKELNAVSASAAVERGGSRYSVKPEKIALCRECKGTGKLTGAGVQACCPNCCGSGRVYVSCEMKLYIRPYRD